MNGKRLNFATAGACAFGVIAVGAYLFTEVEKSDFDLERQSHSAEAQPALNNREADLEAPRAESNFAIETPRSRTPAELTIFIQELRTQGTSRGAIRQLVTERVSQSFAKERESIASLPAVTDEARWRQERLLADLSSDQERMTTRVLAVNRLAAAPAIGSRERQMEERALPNSVAKSEQARGGKQQAEQVETAQTNPAVVPAILASPSPEMQATDVQVAERQRLEQDFLESIGPAPTDPSDPEYYSRWQTEQQRSDALFRQKFGTSAFLKHNMEAWRGKAD